MLQRGLPNTFCRITYAYWRHFNGWGSSNFLYKTFANPRNKNQSDLPIHFFINLKKLVQKRAQNGPQNFSCLGLGKTLP